MGAEQSKNVKVINSDIAEVETYRTLIKKPPAIIYSLDLLEEEIFDSADEARKIIKVAHELLAPGGTQIHMVPYVRLSPRVMGLFRRLVHFEEEGKIKLYAPVQEREKWLEGEAFSRSLLFKENDIVEFASLLGAEVLKNEISSSHWTLCMKKS